MKFYYFIFGGFDEDCVESTILEELLVVYPISKMLQTKRASDLIVCLYMMRCPQA